MKRRTGKPRSSWRNAAWDMPYLTTCGINETISDPERIAKMALEKVYIQSRSQSLEVITYFALEQLKPTELALIIPEQEQVLSLWAEGRNKVIRKTMLMDEARESLCSFLSEKQIWYLPLKGVVISRLYPSFGMRQMADNDILFDSTFRQEVRDWFQAHGYRVKSYGEGNHDEYHKVPIYNFEMHSALFRDSAYLQFVKYYQHIRDKLLPTPDSPWTLQMTDEDFYLSMLAHEYKHYCHRGTGIRSLLDLYVYQKNKTDLDWAYLHGELKKLGLSDFEKKMRTLARKVFSLEGIMEPLTQQDERILRELLSSQTNGRIENVWRKQVKQNQSEGAEITVRIKASYFLGRLIPDRSYMKKWCERCAPYFLKRPGLMPLAYLLRLVGGNSEKRENQKGIQHCA